MIWLDPSGVTFAGASLAGVTSICLDRSSDRFVVERSDLGPHTVFADAPEQLVTLRMVRSVGADGAGALRPGDLGELAFLVGPSASDASVRRVTASVVLRSIANRVDPRSGATQTIECVAISGDGVVDPVSEVVDRG